MKTYIPNIDRLYPDAKFIPVPNHPDRAVVTVSTHMGITEFYPRDDDGWPTDSSILFSSCMGFDPEEFDPKSKETRKWIEEWSYPVETAKKTVSQINQDAKE